MRHGEIARELFAWNAKSLVYSAHLKKSEIGHYFADAFVVIANGRTYHANHVDYCTFLNEFRSIIRAIDYEFKDFIEDERHVVIPLRAKIVRLDSTLESFEAILILKFDENKKIILWHEVYIKV